MGAGGERSAAKSQREGSAYGAVLPYAAPGELTPLLPPWYLLSPLCLLPALFPYFPDSPSIPLVASGQQLMDKN